jgi:hypothetical protein
LGKSPPRSSHAFPFLIPFLLRYKKGVVREIRLDDEEVDVKVTWKVSFKVKREHVYEYEITKVV